MQKTNSNIVQLALDFPHRPSLGKEDFLIANCNKEAVTLIEQWPNWSYFALCIYGPSGCGKSHLANVFAANYAKITNDMLLATITTAKERIKNQKYNHLGND